MKTFDHIDVKNKKVLKIINAAFEIFATNHFDKASTTKILEKSNLSRGVMYHYFKNKQELYDFLIYFAAKTIILGIEENTDWHQTNFFERLKFSTMYKYQIFMQYPYMYDFFSTCFLEKSVEEVKKIEESLSPGTREKFYSYNLDFTSLKKAIDIQLVIATSRYTMAGVINEVMQVNTTGSLMSLKDVEKVVTQYINFLKNQFSVQGGK